jgi:hypothetical protein
MAKRRKQTARRMGKRKSASKKVQPKRGKVARIVVLQDEPALGGRGYRPPLHWNRPRLAPEIAAPNAARDGNHQIPGTSRQRTRSA